VREKTKEVLIPENGPFIKEINKKDMTITVSLPDGFLDMNS
jgi:ribosomal 30S subunit maturation factor RimM